MPDTVPDAVSVTVPDIDCGTPEFVAVSTLPDLLARARVRFADRPALSIDASTVTYAQLYDRATTTARGLRSLGVGRGSRVGLFLPNCLEFVDYLFATSMLGAVVVPINNRFRGRELAHIATDATLTALITSHSTADTVDLVGRVREVLRELPPESRPAGVVLRGESDGLLTGGDELDAAGAGHDPAFLDTARAAIRLRDLAAILYTSGTTAMPKGCLHTHEALVRNGIVTGRSRFLLTPEDRFWDPLPMFHVSFLTPMIACFDSGAHLLSMSRFEPGAAVEQIERAGATWLFAAFQAVAGSLIDEPTFAGRRFDAVRMSMCVGHPADLRRFQRAFPAAQLLSTYGSTETGGVITYHEAGSTAEQRVTTCGTPFRGVELAIAEPGTGARLPTGGTGEILVRGYSVLDGYLNDPVATAAAIDGAGWLHTGDRGRLDVDGHLVFEGRLKDMIKVGGENVAAAEVEALLAEHPGVAVAQVVAAPDARLDEVVAAFVQRAPGADTTADELVAYCRARVAGFKVPRYVRFVTEWPMSATKVRKADLQERIVAELAPHDEAKPPSHPVGATHG